jgi:hypothetical protein
MCTSVKRQYILHVGYKWNLYFIANVFCHNDEKQNTKQLET